MSFAELKIKDNQVTVASDLHCVYCLTPISLFSTDSSAPFARSCCILCSSFSSLQCDVMCALVCVVQALIRLVIASTCCVRE